MPNTQSIEGLEPKRFWHYLAKIAEIPRGSGNETAVRLFVENVGRQNGLESKTDKAGNLLVVHPATEGMEHFPCVALQGHLDMVCEKNSDVVHDFEENPILFVCGEKLMTAKGTSASFDNGVGIATMCMMMEEKEKHGPREYLFTVQEETGLDGANGLEPGFIASKILINLDTEEEGKLYIGCAGGKQTSGTLPLYTEPISPGHAKCKLLVSGLKGGHSGCDIHENRGNAIKILAHALSHLHIKTGAKISSLKGGDKHNAIPREAEADIFVPEEQADVAMRLVRDLSEQLKKEYGETEPVLAIELILMEMEKNTEAHVFKPELQKTLLEMLISMPHGVHKMSEAVPGLVETSSNLASVKQGEKEISVLVSQRSSDTEGLEEICEAVRNVFDAGEFHVEEGDGYPGWNPDINSPLLKKAVDAYEKEFGTKPEIKAIHAGLECGVIGAKFPDMQMISFVPTIKNPHSPDESLDIESVPKFLKLLTSLLSEIR
ncbi:MAG: aminoacyl-histidine dipeptidase [Candidatus Parcubacteria bacterium]|nr:aminoacyl-histidine dipeptidase [Candidatus Parcubacteria bacterium]